MVVYYKRHFCLFLNVLATINTTSDHFYFVKVLFTELWSKHSLNGKDAKNRTKKGLRKRLPKLVEEFLRISNSTLQRFVSTFYIFTKL